MPRLADGFIGELKEKIDLFDLISPYVQLKKSGASWVGLSPFQQEKTPSFYVHPQKGFFKCFSSGETGDAISFVQKIENLEFQEAIEFLSQRFGIPLRYDSKESAQPFVKSIRAQLHSINEAAKNWFHAQIKEKTKESQSALEYWIETRKFSPLDAEKFGVGYAPVNEFALAEHLLKQNFSIEILTKSGLFREKLRQGKLVSIFQGRLMIPIHEKLGKICGFTARKLACTPEWGEKKAPKYINSPETTIFQKSQILFNLHLANKAIRENQDFLLVEGQLDAMRCYLAGFKSVIAPQGTAFTDSQAALLRKSQPRFIICLLDGDAAGKKAGIKYIPIFMKHGLEAKFALLPEGCDPDSVILQQGKEKFSELLKDSISMIQYLVENLADDQSNDSSNFKKTICDFAFNCIEQNESFVVQEKYLNELSVSIGVSDEAVKKDFLNYKNKKGSASIKPKEPSTPDKKNSEGGPVRLTNVEDDLLFSILHDDRIAGPIANIIEPNWLNLHTISGRILAKILAEIRADGPMDRSDIEEILENDEERDVFFRCMHQEINEFEKKATTLQIANQCLRVLFMRTFKERENEIRSLLRDSKDDFSGLINLRNELKIIRKQRGHPPILTIPSS